MLRRCGQPSFKFSLCSHGCRLWNIELSTLIELATLASDLFYRTIKLYFKSILTERLYDRKEFQNLTALIAKQAFFIH